MKYGINTKINSCGRVISSCLEDYKTILFFYNYHFYKQHQAEILSKTIRISYIKRNQKKQKHCKWNICWIKNIRYKNHTLLIKTRAYTPIDKPHIWTNPYMIMLTVNLLLRKIFLIGWKCFIWIFTGSFH